jgi:hypothetical protein
MSAMKPLRLDYTLVTGFEHGPLKHRLFIINDRESTAEHGAGLFETFGRLNPLATTTGDNQRQRTQTTIC